MCPIWPLHLLVLFLLALVPSWVLCQSLPNLNVTFDPSSLTVEMEYYKLVNLTIRGLSDESVSEGHMIQLRSNNPHIGDANNFTYLIRQEDKENDVWSSLFNITGNFLGRTSVRAWLIRGSEETLIDGALDVTVIRPVRVIDSVFTASVATLVSLIFINFGCAMHWPTVKAVCKRPIGPAIGMAGQFLFLPILAFVLGLIIFPDDPAMRLGLYFTGVSPSGGASNIWTFILGGNLNMSLAMTTISTLASFGMMPFWLFTLGRVIFADAQIVVPYQRIATFVVSLIIPLGIGLAMQKYTPKISQFMVRILKGFSTLLLLFIIIFAIVTNLYIFELFSWRIIVAGMGLPWLGYSVAYVIARFVFRQVHEDALAICIETGIQNTGIAIFLLRFALSQPEADLTTVVPVSIAIMTPFPMMGIFIIQKIKACFDNRRGTHQKVDDEDTTPTIPSNGTKDQPQIVSTIQVEK